MRGVLIFYLLLFLFSCKNNSEKEKLINEFTKAIKKNNELLAAANIDLHEQMKAKMYAPKTASKAAVLVPLFDTMKQLVDTIIVNIRKGIKGENSNLIPLKAKLNQLKIWINTQEMTKRLFERNLKVFNNKIDSFDNVTKIKKHEYYLLQNEILIFENEFYNYLNVSISEHRSNCSYNGRPYAMVNINKSHLLNGEVLEVQVVVTNFYDFGKANFFIDGKPFQLDHSGTFIQKIKINKPVGKYNTLLTIEYQNSNTGEHQTISKQIDYTVYELKH